VFLAICKPLETDCKYEPKGPLVSSGEVSLEISYESRLFVASRQVTLLLAVGFLLFVTLVYKFHK